MQLSRFCTLSLRISGNQRPFRLPLLPRPHLHLNRSYCGCPGTSCSSAALVAVAIAFSAELPPFDSFR